MSELSPSSPPPGGGDVIPPPPQPRNPVAILLLNFIGGCVGYFMIGQRNKAIVALIAWVIGLVPPLCGTVSGLVALAAMIDGYLQAQHLQAGHSIRQWSFFNDHA